VTTLAVLIPGPLGFHLFIRWPRDRLRRSTTLIHPADLGEALQPLGHPLVVVMLGTRLLDSVADQVLPFADLIAIPEAWLRRVPKRDLPTRALVASRIASAHRKGPVIHCLAAEHDGRLLLPF
jgi:hypothetical protein